MLTAEFSSIPGFSKLFCDFVTEKSYLQDRFPANVPQIVDLRAKAERNIHRSEILEAISETMNCVELTEKQKENFDLLEKSTTLTVITGQQVGFLGGAIYTLLKSLSAVRFAEDWKIKFAELDFVPIFWIENNDHDAEEIAKAVLLNSQFEPMEFRTSIQYAPNRTSVSSLFYDEAINETIENVKSTLQPTEFSEEIFDLVRNYVAGASVTDVFVKILQFLLGKKGVLFVSAGKLQAQGLFGEIARKELENVGESQKKFDFASHELIANGYHAQAKASEVNLFLTTEGWRHKILAEPSGLFKVGELSMSLEELQELARNSPEKFSPNVLLRPIIQDEIFPTAAYIAGPGEIAYAAELKEAYQFFDVPMPAFLARHSVTFIEPKTAKLLAERELFPQFFFRRYEEVEREIAIILEDKTIGEKFDFAKISIAETIEGLRESVVNVDKTLEATLGRAQAIATQEIDNLLGKLRKAEKRNEETTIKKIKQAHSSLFPLNSLQERTLSPLYFVNKYGRETLEGVLNQLLQSEKSSHYFCKF